MVKRTAVESDDEVGPSVKKVLDKKQVEDSDSDSDVGPLPIKDTEKSSAKEVAKINIADERLLSNLPCGNMYERSFMHRDTMQFINVSKSDFVISSSVDGHIKFWKKNPIGIEFVKNYKSHLSQITAVDVSTDGLLLATAAQDNSLKIYDILNFDMINIISLDFTPKSVCWIFKKGDARACIAVSDSESNNIYIYDARADGVPIYTVKDVHSKPVILIKYNPIHDCVVSVDDSGILEYWKPEVSKISFRIYSF